MALLETDFNLQLLQQQNLTESLVFSPFSIQLVLFCLWSIGAKEEKREAHDQIRNALSINATDEEFKQYFTKSFPSVLRNSSQKGTQARITQHTFPFGTYPIEQIILGDVKKPYGITTLHLRFDADLDANLRNSIHFESDWQNGFFSNATRSRDFFTSADSKRRIDFLHAHHVYRNYTENDHFQVLSLPYKNNNFSLNIFLPKTRFGLKEALKNLDSATIQHLLSNVSETTVEIAIPKWKIGTELKMKEILQAIGITKAFDRIPHHMFVREVTHKAFIEVDENGTNVADDTKVGVDIPLSDVEYSEDPKEFIANHPFLFVLSKDNHTLFIGIHY